MSRPEGSGRSLGPDGGADQGLDAIAWVISMVMARHGVGAVEAETVVLDRARAAGLDPAAYTRELLASVASGREDVLDLR